MAKTLVELKEAVDRNTVAIDAAVEVMKASAPDFDEVIISIDANTQKLKDAMPVVEQPAPEVIE